MTEEAGEGDAPDELEAALNTSLSDVLDLLAAEVERLKAALEFHRLSDAPDAAEKVRWHVQQIDARQDRMEELKALILASGDTRQH